MKGKIVPGIVKPREIISVSRDDKIITAPWYHRVVAKGLDTRTTAVSEITTENPDTLTPDDFAMEALEVMQSRHFRHLPVTDGGKAIGMVPIRDLFAAVKMFLEEDIQATGALVFGDQYGA